MFLKSNILFCPSIFENKKGWKNDKKSDFGENQSFYFCWQLFTEIKEVRHNTDTCSGHYKKRENSCILKKEKKIQKNAVGNIPPDFWLGQKLVQSGDVPILSGYGPQLLLTPPPLFLSLSVSPVSPTLSVTLDPISLLFLPVHFVIPNRILPNE